MMQTWRMTALQFSKGETLRDWHLFSAAMKDLCLGGTSTDALKVKKQRKMEQQNLLCPSVSPVS